MLANDDIVITEATPEHARALALHMRAEDAAEAWASAGERPYEAVMSSLEASDVAFSAFLFSELAAMYGLCPLRDGTVLGGSRTAAVWCLTTPAVNRYPKTFLKACRLVLPTLSERYPALINVVDARYAAAVRWAKWLGFSVQPPLPFGPENLPFHLVILRRPEWAQPLQ